MAYRGTYCLEGAEFQKPLESYPTMFEVVESIGFGAGQCVVIAVVYGTFFAEGLELFIVCMRAPAVAQDLGVDSVAEGLFISCMLAGALVGNLVSGPLSDLAGRQLLITMAYGTGVVFGMVGSFMDSLWSICLLCFLVGLSFGLGQPAAIALTSELSPESWCLAISACSSLFFVLGAMMAVLAVMSQDVWLQPEDHTSWRLLLRMAALVVGLFGFAGIFTLPESPSFLASVGDFAQARDVLDTLQRRNGRRTTSVMFRSTESSVQAPSCSRIANHVLGPQVYAVTLRLCFVAVVVNFAFYGCGYGVPQVLAELLPVESSPGLAPTSVLLVSLFLGGIAILVIAIMCGDLKFSNKGIIVCLAWSSMSKLLFSMLASTRTPGLVSRLLLVMSCVGLCAAPALCLLYLLQVSASIYASPASATGVSLCLAVGRVGAVVAPVALDCLQEGAGGTKCFFLLSACLELIAMLLMVPIPLRELTRAAWAGR